MGVIGTLWGGSFVIKIALLVSLGFFNPDDRWKPRNDSEWLLLWELAFAEKQLPLQGRQGRERGYFLCWELDLGVQFFS